MKLIKFLCLLMLSSAVWAQTATTDQHTENLINNQNWYNTLYGQHPGDCCTGGPVPLYDTNVGVINFSYGQYTAGQYIAINQALQGTGIQIRGYNWGWDIRNLNGVMGGQGGTDSITAHVHVLNYSGQMLDDLTQTYNTQFDWTRFEGTRTFNSPYDLATAGYVHIGFTARDAGFWAGYYGPQVRNVHLSLNYGVDACASNPLSSTSCAGYEAAYLQQQCSINPLHSPACPGYQQAFYTQQCNINALYDAGCPGYAQAYFNQQCTINGLYSRDCPNYAEAYAAKNIINKKEEPVAQVAAVPDPVASSTAPSPSTSTTSPTSVTSVVAPRTETAPAPAAVASNKPEAKPETKSESKSENRPAQNNAQREKAKKEATEAAKNLAGARSLEAQQAAQASIVAGMGMIPGFDVYESSKIPDVVFYRQREIYSNQRPVDNRQAQRFLSGASDVRHQMMIEQQYQLGK